jgi:dTDP-4-dehydrorhamnose reductase
MTEGSAFDAISLNALLPHKIAQLCAVAGARLIHISTDCVFSGSKGMYKEEDCSDATDLYGRTKYLGEVHYPNTVTLRTSYIGPELNTSHGFLEWFLRRKNDARGFEKAIYSGIPTIELAKVIHDYVIPNPNLQGLYHVSADPINKFDLLQLIAKTYGLSTVVVRDTEVVIDRSLDSSRFRAEARYTPPDWTELIAEMHAFG